MGTYFIFHERKQQNQKDPVEWVYRLAPTPTVKPTACSYNIQFRGSFWATVGRVASAGLEEEVTVLVGVVTDWDSGRSPPRVANPLALPQSLARARGHQ